MKDNYKKLKNYIAKKRGKKTTSLQRGYNSDTSTHNKQFAESTQLRKQRSQTISSNVRSEENKDDPNRDSYLFD